jgi:mRNA-degrading endonuclease RelE of RelBE toxin-antitoxin system
MREIEYTTKFKRQYKKLEISLRQKTKETIFKLQDNPFPRDLDVHKLS